VDENNTDYYPFYSEFTGTYPTGGYITDEQPVNASMYVLIDEEMGVAVADENGEDLTVYFFWGNDTLICSVEDVLSYTVVSFLITDYYTMSHDTFYGWYIIVENSTGNMTSPLWGFYTCLAYDLNGDGVINYLDISAIVSHYALLGDAGWIPEDINDDGVVNYLDISGLVSHYGESY
jgi:hypothetical protein